MVRIENILIIPDEVIMSRILLIRGQKVIIDSDLADLYQVATKRLNEQVRRNIKRFPKHFMFELTKEEKNEVVANCDHLKKMKYSSTSPYVFTHYGVLQTANVLNSERAILMSNRIIEVFVRIHEILSNHKDIFHKLERLEESDLALNKKIQQIIEYLKAFEQDRQENFQNEARNPIGYK